MEKGVVRRNVKNPEFNQTLPIKSERPIHVSKVVKHATEHLRNLVLNGDVRAEDRNWKALRYSGI